MEIPLNIVILAAGKGTRMHSDLPKVLHEIAGRPLLTHVIDCAEKLQPNAIVVVYGHGGEKVRETIDKPGIQWAFQAQQLGTGHAVQMAMPYLDGNGVTLVLLGDVPLLRAQTCRQLIAEATHQLALLTVDKAHPYGYGRVVRDNGGSVMAIVEEKDASDEQRQLNEVNSGIMAMPTAQLAGWLNRLSNDNQQGEYYLTDIIAMAVADGVGVVTAQADESEVIGINSKHDLAEVERHYQKTAAAQLLQFGVTLRDPQRLDVRGTLKTGRDVVIDIGCVFEGEVEIGDGVNIGAYCVIRDAVIGAGTSIAPYSHIDSATIASNCRIGPYARLRPGTQLLDNAHVGNFVEIKNSRVDNGSKINHLSYVGDSTVGKHVNIGAGTITCNYDGVNKHRTVIGDHAFIGSDTQLVAPVTVAEGSTIGAGSTITRDTTPNALTLSRSKQITVEGWKRPEKKK
jgi:bifunctional UDP-N-acetylglucosamine pyrophosphorylase/glucosamine-1-phosphate N-acetyltransferase